MRTTAHPRAWGAAAAMVLLVVAAPARAELDVRLSRSTVDRFEPVRLTVRDPEPEADPAAPLEVTIHDARDWKTSFLLEPTGRPGEWSGGFTPTRSGRYTGTAVLRGEGRTQIGLAPTLRVRAGARPGFLRAAGTGRTLTREPGGAFFPVGVRYSRRAFENVEDWAGELGRMERLGINLVELPVEPPPPDGSLAPGWTGIDLALAAAELRGKVLIQLQLPGVTTACGPDSTVDAGPERWVRRWSYSPALAAWRLASHADGAAAAETARRIRRADRYGHLIVSECADRPPEGVDLALRPSNWSRPGLVRALLAGGPADPPDPPLPGEDTWQMLVLGGVGLPLADYDPENPGADILLARLGRLAAMARTVPYHAAPKPLAGVLPADVPAAFCRYGSVLLGWVSHVDTPILAIPSLPRGRFEARILDAERDVEFEKQAFWSDGGRHELRLPEGTSSCFLRIGPVPPHRRTSGARSASAPGSKGSPSKPAAGKPAAPAKTVKKTGAKSGTTTAKRSRSNNPGPSSRKRRVRSKGAARPARATGSRRGRT